MNLPNIRSIRGIAASVAAGTILSLAAHAQKPTTVEGLITGRSGPTMYVRTASTPRLNVTLSDTTKAEEKGNFLGIGKKDLGVAELVPGLEVKIEGTYEGGSDTLTARKVTFSRNSLRTARQIDAGLNPVAEQVASAQDNIRTNRRNIEGAQADIDATKEGLAATNVATAANQQAIDATNGRIGELDQYDTKDTLTVTFANGKSVVSKEAKARLADFVKAAATTPGYMVEVQGYASTKGNAALNQRLSSDRANNVITLIQQSGDVPLTRILAPAAMGTTNQVGDNKTRTGQAENRRVVVTIVVNKGING